LDSRHRASRGEDVVAANRPASSFRLDVDQVPEDDMAERATTRLSLNAAIAKLSQPEQDLIAMRYGADMTAREIALAVGSRTNAVEVALHRAIEKLRLSMDADAPAL